MSQPLSIEIKVTGNLNNTSKGLLGTGGFSSKYGSGVGPFQEGAYSGLGAYQIIYGIYEFASWREGSV